MYKIGKDDIEWLLEMRTNGSGKLIIWKVLEGTLSSSIPLLDAPNVYEFESLKELKKIVKDLGLNKYIDIGR